MSNAWYDHSLEVEQVVRKLGLTGPRNSHKEDILVAFAQEMYRKGAQDSTMFKDAWDEGHKEGYKEGYKEGAEETTRRMEREEHARMKEEYDLGYEEGWGRGLEEGMDFSRK